MMHALSLMPNDMEKYGSRSRLVIVAAQRARQLMTGSRPSGATKSSQFTTIALEEVLNGTVPYVTGKQARAAIKKATKEHQEQLEKLTIQRVKPVDAAEIQKDLSVVVDDSTPAESPALAEW